MNGVISAIMGRRSVRAYTGEPVRREDLDAILECAGYAPFSGVTLGHPADGSPAAPPWRQSVVTVM
jgi:nitroreductase